MSGAGVGQKRKRSTVRSRPETVVCSLQEHTVVQIIKRKLRALEPVAGYIITVTDDGIDSVPDPSPKYIYNYAVLGECQRLLESLPETCNSADVQKLRMIFLTADDIKKEAGITAQR